MRRILTMSLMAIGLTGGIAAADGYRDRDRDRATVNVNVRAGEPHRGEVVHTATTTTAPRCAWSVTNIVAAWSGSVATGSGAMASGSGYRVTTCAANSATTCLGAGRPAH